MIQFHIEAPDKGLEAALQDKIDNLTKPKGSLGTLEALALQVGLIQQTLSPVLRHPVNVIYASDHGIADEGVSKSPKEVTRQVIHNFLNGSLTVASVLFNIFMNGLELLVAFIQAYVFTMLSAVFIGLAQEEHTEKASEKKAIK